MKTYLEFINEAKIDQLRLKYKDLLEFERIAEIDPTETKDYLQWLINIYSKLDSDYKSRFFEDAKRYTDALKLFHEIKKGKRLPLDKRDINRVKSITELQELNATIGGTKEKPKVIDDENVFIDNRFHITNGGAAIYQEDDDVLILQIKTYQASEFYTKKFTEWCIQYDEDFEDYVSRDKLFLIIVKKLLNTDSLERYMLWHFESKQFMDKYDNKLPNNIVGKYIKYFKKECEIVNGGYTPHTNPNITIHPKYGVLEFIRGFAIYKSGKNTIAIDKNFKEHNSSVAFNSIFNPYDDYNL